MDSKYLRKTGVDESGWETYEPHPILKYQLRTAVEADKDGKTIFYPIPEVGFIVPSYLLKSMGSIIDKIHKGDPAWKTDAGKLPVNLFVEASRALDELEAWIPKE